MPTVTATRVITRAHTATHLSNAVAGAIADILGRLGISSRQLMADWPRLHDPAIRAWMEEGSLAAIRVECTQPGGKIEPIFEFPIDYFDDGSVELSHRHVAIARQWAKINRVPAGSAVAVKCQYTGTHTPQSGWGSCDMAPTSHLNRVNFGTLAAGPYASLAVRMYTS
jgi:hypothetical protein